IAWLANGIKRFQLPDEFNYLKVYERVIGRGKSGYGEQARDAIAQAYENRRQYPKAAAAWKEAIKEYGPGGNNHRQLRLDQIVNNWGRFEPAQVNPAGTNATLEFRFRNGKKVNFEAHAIKVETLLSDVQAYLNTNPVQPNWEKINIA